MHELSIVIGITEMARKEVLKAEARDVERIELAIGKHAGIEFDSLEFAWGPGTRGTVLEDSECVIDKIEAKAKCMDCTHTFSKPELFGSCPNCGGYVHHLLQGKELMVKRMVLNK
jgi:hydrogenase nickel incorporation protein HypA/HybF